MAKKFLALIGVFCALVACFALPTLAYDVTFPDEDYSSVRYDYVLDYGAEGRFTSPPTIGDDTYINFADPFAVFMTEYPFPGINPQPYPPEGYLEVSLSSPVRFPLNTPALSGNGDRLVINGNFEASADYVVVFPDGSSVVDTYDYRDGDLDPSTGVIAQYSGVSHVRDVLNDLYPTASFAYVTSLTIQVVDYMDVDTVYQYYTPSTIYATLDPEDVVVNITTFDGDVGVGDLLLSPLEAFFGFEIFPNFTIGGVFGVVISILLFVVILKLFAGG